MEVIWGNRLKPGDFKYIGGFPHFVADGGDDRVGQWLHEKIDLERIYAEIWKDAAPAHLVDVAVFCDSDDTHMASISYFAYVRLEQETDRDRTILFNSNTFRDGQYAKKALLVLEALTADDRRRLGADYAAVIVEGAKRPAEAASIPE
jgi:hypothetical protein